MPFEPVALLDIAELRVEAREARYLAATFRDVASVSDLLGYAAALDVNASVWEEALRHQADSLMADNFHAAI